jgi:hypothetical protein
VAPFSASPMPLSSEKYRYSKNCLHREPVF